MAEKVSLTLIGVLVDFSLMHPGPVNFGPGVGLGQFDMAVGDDRLRVGDRTDVGGQDEVGGHGEVHLDVVGLVDDRGRRADLDTQQRDLVARVQPYRVGEFGAHRPGVFGRQDLDADDHRCGDRATMAALRIAHGDRSREPTPDTLVISMREKKLYLLTDHEWDSRIVARHEAIMAGAVGPAATGMLDAEGVQ